MIIYPTSMVSFADKKSQQLLLGELRLGELRRHMRHGQQPRAQRQRAQELHLAAAHQVLRHVAVPELVIQSPENGSRFMWDNSDL